MIYISTLAFKGKTILEMIEIAKANGWALEFSSGLPYQSDMIDIYSKANVMRMPHNYFPAPQVPFVVNLASLNPEILFKSIEHCKQGLKLAKQSESPFFAAHAGFCIDPDPDKLGKQLNLSDFNRKDNWGVFVKSLNEVLNYAKELDIPFLIENNVIAAFNLVNGENPLLCAEPLEIEKIFNEIGESDYFGLLLDTGHFKVSATTMKFDILEGLERVSKYIKGIHHNDNDGKRDTNEILTSNYWFNDHLPVFKNIPQVLEVKCANIEEVKTQIIFLENGN